jgi:hypothetical protein
MLSPGNTAKPKGGTFTAFVNKPLVQITIYLLTVLSSQEEVGSSLCLAAHRDSFTKDPMATPPHNDFHWQKRHLYPHSCLLQAGGPITCQESPIHATHYKVAMYLEH